MASHKHLNGFKIELHQWTTEVPPQLKIFDVILLEHVDCYVDFYNWSPFVSLSYLALNNEKRVCRDYNEQFFSSEDPKCGRNLTPTSDCTLQIEDWICAHPPGES